ncbi:hypothetical protein APS_2609 [Acetobacter pasteurianus subsp. pasteurianus LMG 1262 = NBRC 106471]|nr:hypothetical protein APS_2609 [Acetobacter pasteurianus subsp. pasteurianus LMG 1262 = NBRC 106471]GCD51134.1 hypothetical protein NBRC106471_2690 [Acetobacter pasteurianus subsp. pasteurianus LMG 1262 = NBRC 106471]
MCGVLWVYFSIPEQCENFIRIGRIKMSENKGKTAFARIMSNTTTIVVGRVLNAICSFIYVPLTVQAAGLNGFGNMLLITSYLILISDITHLHSWQPLVHYGTMSLREKNFREFNQILTFCMRSDGLSGMIGTIVGLCGIAVFGNLLAWPSDIKSLAEVCSITILFMNRGWPVGALRLLDKFKIATTIELVGTITRTVGSFIGYEYKCGLSFFVFLWCFTQIALFAIYNIVALRFIHEATRQRFPWKELFFPTIQIPGIWKLTLGTSLNEILQAFFKQISTLLIGAWMGAGDAAIFRVASQITNALAKPANMMIPALYPEFIRSRDDGNVKELKYILMRIYATISILAVVVLTVSITLGSNILNYMLHHSIPQGGMLIAILATSAMIDISVVPLEPLLTVMGRVYSVLHAKAFAIIVYMPVLFELTKYFGIWGAAGSAVVASTIMLWWCSIAATKIFALTYPSENT